ncbi:hypothetical protein BD410DRAFT_743013 [Rickenella mellea]|uniref:Clathrin/coatomer adaptor adaptin-like N-terminal domain-containing protein n=1 Tax=Rickenella mellea TaxID=50990 RepID=A0A4Y7QDR3_9AGAM|nr:hypothetical protein BD410DRAFT_743013 [Rickenella mellea]
MSSINLSAFTENASRLGARIQETLSERTRDLALTRSVASSYFDVPEDKVKNVRKQLDSSSDREKLDGIKTLIALISKGRDVSEFFPDVVKNVASQNLEIRKLVYIYLLRYAESEPDLALLSINSFQKDLTDSNPLIRAMALRVLSGIKVPLIGNIVVLAIKKCAADVSPYVRKAAALAMIKCYNMDPSHLSSLIPILSGLLKDKSPLAIGSVALAFQAICPTRLDLLHQNYRRLCRMLVDADEWGQVDLLDLLARYARTMLPKPERIDDMDQDMKLLLECAEPSFMSRNPSVVLAVTRLFHYLAPPSERHKYVDPLLRLLPRSKEIERIVLSYLVVLSHDSPSLFAPLHARFYVRATNIYSTKRDKIRILLNLATAENYQPLTREFMAYADDSDDRFVSDAIHALGRCARLVPQSMPDCVIALMSCISKNSSDAALSASVVVLKSLIQSKLPSRNSVASSTISPSHGTLEVIAKLAGKIEQIKHPSARACVLWLVGQYASSDGIQSNGIPGIVEWAPDVLRRTVKTFSSEAPIVKLQVITLATKLHLLAGEHDILSRLIRYTFSLARYDLNYDVRDRARMLGSLLTGIFPTAVNGSSERSGDAIGTEGVGGVVLRREQVMLVLFEGKQGVVETESWSDEHNLLGSLETVLGRSMGLDSARRLPDWLEEGTEPSLRDNEDDEINVSPFTPAAVRSMTAPGHFSNMTPVVLTPRTASPLGPAANQPGKGGWEDLDAFYGSESAESGSDEDDDDSEGEEDSEVEPNDSERREGIGEDGGDLDDNGYHLQEVDPGQ